MKVAYTISVLGHAAILLWSVWTLSARSLPVTPPEALPVDLVKISDLTQMTAGNKDAPKAETPKPVVEKVAETKPVEDVTAKVVEKKEVKAAREPPPAAEAKPVETKPAKAEPKSDPIAETLAQEPLKKPETKKAEAKTPAPAKKPAPPAPKFDPNKVAELLDKRDATRVAAAGSDPNSLPSVGLPKGNAKELSISELDALVQRLMKLWTPPEVPDKAELVSRFVFKLKRDGTLADAPTLVFSKNSPVAVAAREAAARAIFRGQPYDMLRPENYELWKEIEVTFDPRLKSQ